jgi:hypothetical protein
VKLSMSPEFQPSGLFKTLLVRTYRQKTDADLLAAYSRLLAHTHLKLLTFKTITEALSSQPSLYTLQEQKLSSSRVIFLISAADQKSKLAEIEVCGISLFFTAYNQVCLSSFIPLCPRVRVMVRDVKEMIERTAGLQRTFFGLVQG